MGLDNLRDEVAAARIRYEAAKLESIQAHDAKRAGLLGEPDGQLRITEAMIGERRALAEYSRVLGEFTQLVLGNRGSD